MVSLKLDSLIFIKNYSKNVTFFILTINNQALILREKILLSRNAARELVNMTMHIMLQFFVFI